MLALARRNISFNVTELLSNDFSFSIVKISDRYFCYFTAAMFVSLRRTPTWRLHTKLHKFWWHASANNARIKNSRDLILGEVVFYQSSIVSQILDFIHWMVTIFSFDHGLVRIFRGSVLWLSESRILASVLLHTLFVLFWNNVRTRTHLRANDTKIVRSREPQCDTDESS